MKKIWPLLTLIAVFILAGGVFLFKKVVILQLENMDHPKTIRMKMNSQETFSMFYIHSIYNQPVTEEFQAEKDSIVLKGIRTKSPGVMEYYGFQDTNEFHPMNIRLGAVFLIRRGMGEGQGVIVKDRKIYLSEIGEKGDRIQLRLESMPLGKYIFKMLE